MLRIMKAALIETSIIYIKLSVDYEWKGVTRSHLLTEPIKPSPSTPIEPCGT